MDRSFFGAHVPPTQPPPKVRVHPMSIYSMTGYASAQTEITLGAGELMRIGLEVRAVNSRFLDLSFKMPEEFRAFESLVREEFTKTLKRGKVDIRLYTESSARACLKTPSSNLLQEINHAQVLVKAQFPNAKDLTCFEILKLSEQHSAHAHELPAQEQMHEHLKTLVQEAMAQLLLARKKEGERLVESLLERLRQIQAFVVQAKPLVPLLVQQQREKFLERWREALGHENGLNDLGVLPQAAQERALSEATAFAIKIDVAEELTRLNAHLDEIEQCLSSTKPQAGVGKRLDFLIQELHRESNTLGSKSTTLELSNISIEMKVLIEQMREQVQNLE